MADWIKLRTDLYRHPKVLVIADHLYDPKSDLAAYVNQNMQRDMTVTRNVTRSVTVGALVSVWGVMRHRGKRDGDDLVIENLISEAIDDIADIPGFGDAMIAAGWLVDDGQRLVFPRFFCDHNVDPSDTKKEKAKQRQQRRRAKLKGVTEALRVRDSERDCHAQRESRERVETIKESKPKKSIPPTIEEVRAYCDERGKGVNVEKWFAFYESKGWMIGKNKMTNWKAAVHTWEQSKAESNGEHKQRISTPEEERDYRP